MKKKTYELELHYSIQNCGDGSAAITWLESSELAEWDQEKMNEDGGWGEPCTGSITLESESPITFKKKIETKEKYLLNLIADNNDSAGEFIEQFFPNGLPQFTIEIEEIPNQKSDYLYVYNIVRVNCVEVDRVFRRREISGDVFETLLNNYDPEGDDE